MIEMLRQQRARLSSALMPTLNRVLFNYKTGEFLQPEIPTTLNEEEKAAVDEFETIYYRKWMTEQLKTVEVSWMGYLALKTPADLWIYQEIIARRKPDLIIECGTHMGGSSLYLASICQLIGHGRVVTIDINNLPGRPSHSLLTYIHGSTIDSQVIEQVRTLARGTKRRMVILDSDHSCAHVSAELEAYKDFVTVGDYLIVEDTIVNGHPLLPDFGPGPMEAVQQFLPNNPTFVIDDACERLMATMNPRGFLRRV